MCQEAEREKNPLTPPDDTGPQNLRPIPRGPGRPASGQAMSAAERMRRYRERQKATRAKSEEKTAPLSQQERAELEQLREIAASYENIVTRYEKQVDELTADNRALNRTIDEHRETEARLRRILHDQAAHIRQLEAKRQRRKDPQP